MAARVAFFASRGCLESRGVGVGLVNCDTAGFGFPGEKIFGLRKAAACWLKLKSSRFKWCSFPCSVFLIKYFVSFC